MGRRFHFGHTSKNPGNAGKNKKLFLKDKDSKESPNKGDLPITHLH